MECLTFLITFFRVSDNDCNDYNADDHQCWHHDEPGTGRAQSRMRSEEHDLSRLPQQAQLHRSWGRLLRK